MSDGARVLDGVAALRREHGRLAVVVGVFDGLHRGHRHLLRRLVRQAAAWRARPAVITFDAHPDAVLRGHAPPLLLDPQERRARLEAAGVEIVVVEHFDDRLRTTPYDAFVAWITDRVELAGFVMTPESAFGHERRGTPATVAELGGSREPPFEVALVPPLTLDGRPVSSSAIRTAIAEGDLETAGRLLGRGHAVVGSAADTGSIDFAMPVALPPRGRYDVRVSGPWRPGARGRPVVAEVTDDLRVVLERPRGGTIRVEFRALATR
jgi:riboflavin kinase/FMN adenylyltransferase